MTNFKNKERRSPERTWTHYLWLSSPTPNLLSYLPQPNIWQQIIIYTVPTQYWDLCAMCQVHGLQLLLHSMFWPTQSFLKHSTYLYGPYDTLKYLLHYWPKLFVIKINNHSAATVGMHILYRGLVTLSTVDYF